jgi:hypothetical protein
MIEGYLSRYRGISDISGSIEQHNQSNNVQ